MRQQYKGRYVDRFKSKIVMLVLMRRIDPQAHMDRWYLVTVQPTLFEPVAVVCQYGNRQTNWQQTRILPAVTQAEAETIATEIVKAKLKRGYTRVE